MQYMYMFFGGAGARGSNDGAAGDRRGDQGAARRDPVDDRDALRQDVSMALLGESWSMGTIETPAE